MRKIKQPARGSVGSVHETANAASGLDVPQLSRTWLRFNCGRRSGTARSSGPAADGLNIVRTARSVCGAGQMYCAYVRDVIRCSHEDTDGSTAGILGRSNRGRVAPAQPVEVRRGARATDGGTWVAPGTAGIARRHLRHTRLGRRAATRSEYADEKVPEVDRLWRQARSLMPVFSWRFSAAAMPTTTGQPLKRRYCRLPG